MHNINYLPNALWVELIRRSYNDIDQIKADQGYKMPSVPQEERDAFTTIV